jgi:hypothetical protein
VDACEGVGGWECEWDWTVEDGDWDSACGPRNEEKALGEERWRIRKRDV